MTHPLTEYQSLVTSQYRDKAKCQAVLAFCLQPLIDSYAFAEQVLNSFDVDTAVGNQLDIIAEWVGVNRLLQIPISNVWFTFNTGPGFNNGMFIGPYDPKEQVYRMLDDAFRRVIKAKIALNHWNGSLHEAQRVLKSLFPTLTISMSTTGPMTYTLTFTGTMSPIEQAIINAGYFDFKPAGVSVTRVVTPT